jgi:hypothetical protein
VTEPLVVCSYGGGVQSTAILVLAAQGYLPYKTFLFANVGDDSEHPATLDYVRDVAFDYAAAHGITIHELHRVPKRGISKGEVETLWGRLMRPGSRSLPIPVRMSDTGAPGTRSCTADFKIAVVGRWLREHGASADNVARVAIGISTDEFERATSRKVNAYESPEYPLLTLEHRLAPAGANRDQCKRIIADAGLPIPPKSSCFFCPFHRPRVFADMARTEPELFDKAVLLEDTLNERRDQLGKDRVYLTRFGRRLGDVFANVQGAMFDDWDEDEGYRCGDRCDT